ncbi:MAG TPA: serpin family protein [Gemmatimonadaceae bacterium]
MSTSLDIRPLLAAALLASSTACAAATGPHDGGAQAATLDALPRSLTGAERSTITAANDFSLALFRVVSTAQKDQNVFISPLSASMALGMTMNGASGTTYDQMRGALSFGGMTQSDIDAGYHGLIALLRGLDPAVQLGVANSVWYRSDFPIRQSFLDTVSTSFGARVAALDFTNPSSVGTINGWVNDATGGKIASIIDTITPKDVMFLINAIYFKGSWRERFDPTLTGDAPFHGVAGDRPMRLMHRTGTVRYFATGDLQAADLPYGNSAFNMTVLLPGEGHGIEALAASLQANQSLFSTDQFREMDVDFAMPRFKLEWQRALNDDLQALGMHDAFNSVADFTRMSPRGRELYISLVKQKTFVEVNEEGTEAAAATSVGVGVTALPARPIMRVDHPFVFVVRERLSGTILFMGKVVTLP